ncbi:hypothetical protein [Ferviditalea candida]|uniref:Uncharacterized protein n=1 Tax=Ferviditalea candida TaxID=3108399 RepID=A0ABU5ZE11_9BACL|nr:hypothetical protein [Paenibacillaceae bacterium T2]
MVGGTCDWFRGIIMLPARVAMISIRRKEPLTIAEKKWFLCVGLANTPILFWGYLLSAFWFGGAAYSSSSRPGKPSELATAVSTGFKGVCSEEYCLTEGFNYTPSLCRWEKRMSWPRSSQQTA